MTASIAKKRAALHDESLSEKALSHFQHIVKRELLFHCLFIGLAALAFIFFLFFFSFLSDSFLMGIFIACLFFGVVLYFVLKLYFQEQKPQELLYLRNQYLSSTNDEDAVTRFVKVLDQSRLDYIATPSFLDFVKPTIEKFLATYHWRDVHLFKELFLRANVDQMVQRVIKNPTESASHKSLASGYMSLGEHFHRPLDTLPSSSKTSELFWEHFQTFFRLAIEELLIVKEYSPNDLWTSTKLAECYLTLGMLDQAIVEYETILENNPDDADALFSLGTLYFKQGLHGKGLKIYEQLQLLSPNQAEELIALYGSHDSSTFGHIPPSTSHLT